MVLEIAFVTVLPENHRKFENALNVAVKDVLSTAKGFRKFEVRKGVESPNTYNFLIHWSALEDHTVGFRQGELFVKWREHIGQYFAEDPIVHHWESV